MLKADPIPSSSSGHQGCQGRFRGCPQHPRHPHLRPGGAPRRPGRQHEEGQEALHVLAGGPGPVRDPLAEDAAAPHRQPAVRPAAPLLHRATGAVATAAAATDAAATATE